MHAERQLCVPQSKPEDGTELVRADLREPRCEKAANARGVVALSVADKFRDAQAPCLGSSEPQQVPSDSATSKLTTNVDGDISPFAIDLNVGEPDTLVLQEANPSVPDRGLLNKSPPCQVSSVEADVKALRPFLVLGEPGSDQRGKIPRQRREDNGRRRRSHRHSMAVVRRPIRQICARLRASEGRWSLAHGATAVTTKLEADGTALMVARRPRPLANHSVGSAGSGARAAAASDLSTKSSIGILSGARRLRW
jgi:hypothetical protein